MKVLLTREECRKVQIALLENISKICDEHSISYSLAYGSLLGAVRHKGYIPWDDDIDVLLLRKDYERLSKVLKSQKNVAWMDVLEESTENNVFPYMKVVDNRTVVKADDNNASHGIWIDIFPIDNLPDNAIVRKLFLFRCVIKRAMVLSSITDFSSKNLGKKGIAKKILFWIVKILGQKRVVKSYQHLMTRYAEKNTKYVGCLASAYIEKEAMERSVYNDTVLMEFEGHRFACLKEFDRYLSHLYGDYMKLPDENKRKTHEIVAWSIED